MRKPPALLVVFGVSAALLAVLPIGYLVLRLFEGFDKALAELLRLRTLELLGNTILLVTAVSISALVLGFAQAWLTTRSNVKFAVGVCSAGCSATSDSFLRNGAWIHIDLS